jgi:hypothetical protein
VRLSLVLKSTLTGLTPSADPVVLFSEYPVLLIYSTSSRDGDAAVLPGSRLSSHNDGGQVRNASDTG